MRAKFIALTFFLYAIASSQAFGMANLWNVPQIIRQTYYDGTFTEVQCDRKRSSDPATCIFRVGFKRKTLHSYTFRLADYGYENYLATDSHLYVPSVAQFPLTVIFQIQCSESDMQLVSLTEQDYADCSIYLSPDGKSLRATMVRVIATVDGKDRRADRVIEGSPVNR